MKAKETKREMVTGGNESWFIHRRSSIQTSRMTAIISAFNCASGVAMLYYSYPGCKIYYCLNFLFSCFSLFVLFSFYYFLTLLTCDAQFVILF